MKITVTENIFIDTMRAIRPDNFSYEGLQSLFAFLDDYGQGLDYEQELDPIEICCTFSQCSLKEFKEAYSVEVEEGQSLFEAVESYISKNGFWYDFVEGNQEVVFENL